VLSDSEMKEIARFAQEADAWIYSDGILSNWVASLVLEPERRYKVLDRNRKIPNENLAALEEWVHKHKPLFELIPPRAGGVAFPRYNMKINSTELADKLLNEKSVFIVTGDFFGMDQYIRIGIGTEKDYFKAGLSITD